MPLYDQEVNSHEPIHEDAITWEQFMTEIKNGTYEADKIYFIGDVDTQKQLLERLLEEIYIATQQLNEMIGGGE